MKTTTWAVLMAVAVTAVSFACTSPALAQAGDETVAAETEYCGICEVKKSVAGALPGWFEFGLDLRNRVEYKTNATTLGANGTEEGLLGRFRPRLWAYATPVENVQIGARLVWEFFVICKPEAADNTPSSDVTFDELFVKWTDVLGAPVEVTVGRQNMRLGDGWLVFEGTPLDGSRTTYFDAIRTTWAMVDQNMSLDAIFVANTADTDSYIKPFNDNAVERLIAESDETGGILWLTNTANEDLTWNGYFIYVHRDDPDSADNMADLYTAGARVAGNWGEQIQYRAEGAYQFGNKDGAQVRDAFGVNSRITYLVQDAMDTALHAGYEYRSGDDNPAKNFDILWGRYVQFSDLFAGNLETLEGLPAGAASNFHRFNVGAAAEPVEDVIVLLNYNLLLADENNLAGTAGFSDSGDVRGHLFSAQVKMTHNEHATSVITGEAFLPGNYYTDAANDVATFARYELMLVW
ncbi:MAG: alginate export family protein [Planctomycetes bacterium]|nr:alginate export family protein [Planctomycetota bacterium]